MIGIWTANGWLPPEGFMQDVRDPTWWFKPDGDPNDLEATWWRSPQLTPPDGFYPDVGNPGWYWREGGLDPNDPENWWHDDLVRNVPVQEPTIVDMRGRLPANGSYPSRSVTGIEGITVHYTAGPSWNTVEDIARMQLNIIADPSTGTRFPGIAYTMFVAEDGTINLCHDLATRSWHSAAVINGKGRNYTHVGIVYPGDYAPNDAQIAGLAYAIDWVCAQIGRELPVEGHRDAPYATQCPGPAWPAWRDRIL